MILLSLFLQKIPLSADILKILFFSKHLFENAFEIKTNCSNRLSSTDLLKMLKNQTFLLIF